MDEAETTTMRIGDKALEAGGLPMCGDPARCVDEPTGQVDQLDQVRTTTRS
jgi:hypothetical protein